MKKVISVCLLFFIVLTLFAGTALADWPTYSGRIKDAVKVILIDADSGKELASQNKDDRIEPASTTKIMTCILAIENSNMDDKVTISKKAANSTLGSVLGIKEKEEFEMQDLLTGMMLKSGNDAAVAAAESISGSVDDFAVIMNEKARSLGMTSTHFVNANGLHDENHYSTTSDMARLARYAMQNQTFREIVQLPEFQMPETNKQHSRKIENTNGLLKSDSEYYYSYATGVKTGSTTNAGGCLVASATKDDNNLICLIFNDQTTNRTDRWGIAKSLFKWGFDNFSTIDVSTLLGDPVKVSVQDCAADDAQGGMLEFMQPEAGTAYVTLPKDAVQGLLDGTDTLEAKPAYDKALTAPVSEGDVFGTVTYSSKATGEEIYSCDLIASRDILKPTAVISTTPEPTPESTPEKTPEPTPAGGDGPKIDNTLFAVIIIAAAGGLTAFLTILVIMKRRSRSGKRRRQITVTGNRTI